MKMLKVGDKVEIRFMGGDRTMGEIVQIHEHKSEDFPRVGFAPTYEIKEENGERTVFLAPSEIMHLENGSLVATCAQICVCGRNAFDKMSLEELLFP